MNRTINHPIIALVFCLFIAASPAFAQLTDNGDGTVTDARTGLTWLKESFPKPGAPDPARTWKDAMLWANSLNVAGHNDWRLPSALEVTSGVPDLLWNSTNNEWGSLYGITWANPANDVGIAPMSNYPCCWYWTSTEDPANSTRAAAFFVSYDGLWLNQIHPKNTPMRYTAVRGAPKPAKAPQCNDGYDNDSNGLVDFPEDQGCSSAQDDWEFTCVGITGLLACRNYRIGKPWLCFRIDDSTICIEWPVVVAAIVLITIPFGYWFRRKRKEA